MCDNSRQAINIIKKNIEKTHTEDKTEIYQTSYEDLLNDKIKEKPTITFIDPPYDTDFAYKAVNIMVQNGLIDRDSIIIIETDQEKRIIEQLKKVDIQVIDIRKYGRANLIFLNQKRKG